MVPNDFSELLARGNGDRLGGGSCGSAQSHASSLPELTLNSYFLSSTVRAISANVPDRAPKSALDRRQVTESPEAYELSNVVEAALANLDETQLSLIYWNVRLRLVGSVPRKVNWAKEFTCPPQMRAGLDALIEKFEKGEDVNPHQSNAWVLPGNRSFNDRLFDNWRIKHFHLGLNGKREDDCLFAVVTASDVYAVAIYPHGHYGENQMVERLKANWPQLLRGSDAALKPTGTPLDNAQTIAARKRATPLTELADGSTYGPLGGGTTSSGVGGRVVDVMDRAFDRLNEWQAGLDSNAAAEIQKAQAKGIVFRTPPTLKLKVDGKNDFYASDDTADWGIKLGQLLDVSID